MIKRQTREIEEAKEKYQRKKMEIFQLLREKELNDDKRESELNEKLLEVDLVGKELEKIATRYRDRKGRENVFKSVIFVNLFKKKHQIF